MDRQRIGQELSQMGKLTEIDINEILMEQRLTRRPFGEIALRWGLCEPRHVWKAWCRQIDARPQHVDLEAIGVDAQAAGHFTRELAEHYGAIPIRVVDDQLLLAAGEPLAGAQVEEIRRAVGHVIHCVTAPAEQVTMAIRAYYAPADERRVPALAGAGGDFRSDVLD